MKHTITGGTQPKYRLGYLENIYFYYQKMYLQGQSIQKTNDLILKITSLAGKVSEALQLLEKLSGADLENGGTQPKYRLGHPEKYLFLL